MSQYDLPYRIVKAKGAKTAVFIRIEDSEALDTFCTQHGNRDLLVSVAFYESADPSSRYLCALCFRIRSSSLEQARQSALEVVYYLAENCGILEDSVELSYTGGGIAPDDDDRTDAGTAAPPEIVISVPPAVFGGRPTPVMPVLNYDLARQMSTDGIENLDIDVYVRDHFVPLPDSINGATGRFVVSVRVRELRYLDPKGILDLSKQPRGDDFFAIGNPVWAAEEWFAKVIEDEERHERRQSQLRQRLLHGGWQIPPCVRRLHWADLPQDQVLEACRIIARFYPFINAGNDETWYHLLRLDRRHDIGDHARLRAIIAFGVENPGFAGCQHPLLQQFCPAGGCLINELLNELKNPRLFV